jgi:hypothetical protein
MDGLIIVGTLIRSKLYYDYMSTIFEPSTDKSVKTIITGYSSDKTETECGADMPRTTRSS